MVSLGGLVGAQPHSIVDEAGAPHELTVYARGGMSPLSVTPSQLNTLRGGVFATTILSKADVITVGHGTKQVNLFLEPGILMKGVICPE